MPRLEGDTYFNNFIQSGYEELRDWSPAYYRDILEADANFRLAGSIDDTIALKLEELCQNFFIDTMNTEALSRMERFFHLEGNASLSIQERRSALKAAQIGNGKVSRERLGRMVQAYTGYYPEFDFIHRLDIRTAYDGERELLPGKLMQDLRRTIPAHIAFLLNYRLDFIIDESDIEQYSLTRVRFKMPLYMWPLRVLDGTWILDGGISLDSARGYGLRLGLLEGPYSASNKEARESLSLRFLTGIEANERIKAGIRLYFKQNFWGEDFLDGTWLLDGCRLLGDVDKGLRAKLFTRSGLYWPGKESFGNAELIEKTAGYWTLGGGVPLEGSRLLNAESRREVLE